MGYVGLCYGNSLVLSSRTINYETVSEVITPSSLDSRIYKKEVKVTESLDNIKENKDRNIKKRKAFKLSIETIEIHYGKEISLTTNDDWV